MKKTNSKPVTVVAAFEARPGKEAELKQVLQALLAPTRKEKGCISYDLHVAQDNPARLLFYENWESRELLDVHLKSAHLTAAIAQAHSLTASEPVVQFWDKLA